jgi:hypothetical protein
VIKPDTNVFDFDENGSVNGSENGSVRPCITTT